MSLMSYLELRREVQNKMMFPCPDECVNASSIDVRLGSLVLEEARKEGTPEDEYELLELGKRQPLITREVDISEEGLTLFPGQFVLAHTMEKFSLPLDVSAEFRLKSSAARMGLSHVLAVWCDPGWTGSSLTLELHNVSQHHAILLKAGDRVGQMIFHRHIGVPESRSYAVEGAYNFDESVSAAKPSKVKSI